MLKDKNAIATIAVKNLDAARRFYEGTLGFVPDGDNEDSTVSYASGGAHLLVYASEFAGTNKATAATFDVGPELDALVKELRGKGVVFEHYDMPGLTLHGDVHVSPSAKVAWLKDPDGNILSLFSAA